MFDRTISKAQSTIKADKTKKSSSSSDGSDDQDNDDFENFDEDNKSDIEVNVAPKANIIYDKINNRTGKESIKLKGFIKKAYHAFMFPITYLSHITIPNPR